MFAPPLCSSGLVFGLFFSLRLGFGGFFSLVFGVVWCCSATVLLLFCLNGLGVFTRAISISRYEIPAGWKEFVECRAGAIQVFDVGSSTIARTTIGV